MAVSEVILIEERLSVAAVFIVYLAVMTVLGMYARRVLRRTAVDRFVEEFYVAGRGLGAVVVAFIIAAGLCSVGTFLGGPGLAWLLGMPWASLMGVQIFMNFYILYGLGRKIGIVARRINAISFGDILYERYDRSRLVALLYTITIVIFFAAYSSTQFVGSARVFEVMTGWHYMIVLVLVGVITVFYSVIGGIRGVGLTIVVQGVFMTLCYALLIAFMWGRALADYGSLTAINEALIKTAGEDFMNVFRLPIAWVASMWIIFNLGILALPHGVMAALTYKSVKSMKRAIYIGLPIVTFWTYGIWAALIGKIYFPKLSVPDHINPMIAMKFIPAGLGGIVYAGVISAAMSTVAAMLVLMSSAIVRHIYTTFIKPEELRKASLLSTLGVGIVSFILAVSAPPALEYVIIMAIGGTISALFWPIVGLFWRRANRYGAIASMIVGLSTYIIDKLNIVRLSVILFRGSDPVMPGLVFSLIAFLIATYMTPPPSRRTLQLFWGAKPPEK
jgi:sodium/pantothenate symporter